MSNTTMVDNKTQNQKQKQKQDNEESKLSTKALNNLSELDLTLTTSSLYFKPEPEKTYAIKINPEEKVEMVRNPKFADKDGNVPTRFEFKIKHVNNGSEQSFTVSKTLCKQIVTELGKGCTVLEITRHGTDRSTTWAVKGIQ